MTINEQLEEIIRYNINASLIHDDRIADLVQALSTWHNRQLETKVREAQNKLLNIGTGNTEGLASVNMGEVSDGYHTFNELYEFRMLYNAAFFNLLCASMPKNDGSLFYKVHKSYRHSDGELCFGGGWFIVMATLPTGQIGNHYENKHWDLFQIPERNRADKWDGHTPQDIVKRLTAFCHQDTAGVESGKE